MVLFNYSTKELTAKVVYYGPGLCGKTTNLQWIHEKLPIKNKGKMLSLATETDRTLFFDFLPIELGTIRGMRTRVQLYTVPGQVFYNATRRMVLKGADCVVFVADSQAAMLEANLESLENLRQNLEANELNPDEMPMVLQYNKRDLPNALPIEILNERLNPRASPFFEAVAIKGQGVEETLKGVTQLVFRSLAARYGGAEPAPAAAVPPPAPPKPAPPPAVAAPPPPPRPAPPARPPLPAPADVPDPTDALLDSLELESAPPPAPTENTGPVELSFAEPEVEELESLDLEELSRPAPAPPPRAPSPAAASPQPKVKSPEAAKTTLVSGPKETEEIRRKITAPPPPVPDLTLDELGDEDDDYDEVPPPPVAPPARPTVVRSPAPPPARPSPSEARIAATTIPPSVRTDPVKVTVPASSAGTELTIPVEVKVEQGGAQISIHLRLTLSLKLQR